MCKLCRDSEALGRLEARVAVTALAESILERRDAGEVVEPEAYFNGVVAEVTAIRDRAVRQFRLDGNPACPMERNKA